MSDHEHSEHDEQPEPDTSSADQEAAERGEEPPEPQATDAEADVPADDEQPEEASATADDDHAIADETQGGEGADEEAPIAPDPDAVTITVNGRAFAAHQGELVINAAERAGEYIPRFCYHPRMSSVGMCRQCLVEIDTGRGPAIQPSCMITVAPDMAVITDSHTVERAQEGVLELLLANHPLDCPVCDKGGECPLQDQTMSHGPGESRYVEQKRHYEKPIPISDHVLLDRERCILCDRCTRFADEVAGDKLIHFIDRGNNTEVATFPDEPFASYFSGNTVQICPVGALTAKPYRFKARPWDLEQADSTCTTCSVGCRVSVHSSRDQLLRYQGVDTGLDTDSVNLGWMCDRGRFNFEAVESELRLADPQIRGEAGLATSPWTSALSIVEQLLRDASTVALLGGARSTNEGAFAWAKLADALGIEHRDAQLGDGLPAGVLDLPRATIDDAVNASTVILLGPDLKEELPVLYLRLREAAVGGGTKLVEFSTQETGLTRYAWKSVRHAPGMGATEVARTLADPAMAEQLASGKVVIVAGRGNLAASEETALAALQAARAAVPEATVLPALRRGNVVGALQLGLAPADAAHDATATLQACADGKVDVLVLLGADPLNDCPDADLARRGLAGARRIISIDTHPSESTQQADVVLPAAAFAEQSGTTTNLEGRVTDVAHKVTAHGTSRPDWMIATELAARLGHDLGFASIAEVTAAIVADVPGYATAFDGGFATGAVPALPDVSNHEQIPSGYDFRLVVSRKLYDRAVNTVMSPSIAKLNIGAGARVHSLDLPRVGVDDGTDVKLISAKGSVVLPLIADDTVQRGTIWAPFNMAGADVTDLVDAAASVTDVRIERLT
ncbi:MAG: NADH dehydrogenase (quinone) subunit G [Acidimicrobiaceae bacterium]|nr:NADH dehydrogenase (quinone) subunit G [Acidimicrobiaceae bacterium]